MQAVRAFIKNNFFAMIDPNAVGNLIAHGAGGQKNSGFLRNQIGNHLTEFVNSRVFLTLLITNRRICHFLAHFGRRQGAGIAVQINARRASVCKMGRCGDHGRTFCVKIDMLAVVGALTVKVKEIYLCGY